MITEASAFSCVSLAITSLWFRTKQLSLTLIAAALGLAVYVKIISIVELLVIVFAGALAFLMFANNFSMWTRRLCAILFTAISTPYMFNCVPSAYLHQWLLYSHIKLSETSAYFNFSLNFDKPFVGIFLLLFSGILIKKNLSGLASLKAMAYRTVTTAALCTTVMLFPAYAIHYIAFDPKLPDIFFIWAVKNLLFVCVIEEAFFRYWIQGQLIAFGERFKLHWTIGWIFASILFGLAHISNGSIAFALLATIAGLFYGYVYQKTKRLESSIMVHFLLNTVHFLFFTYPYYAK